LTYHQQRYRTDEKFAQREKDRAKARYKALDEIGKKRVYLSCTIYRLVEARDHKLMQAKELDDKISALKKEREEVKWKIYSKRKNNGIRIRKDDVPKVQTAARVPVLPSVLSGQDVGCGCAGQCRIDTRDGAQADPGAEG
jgi:hypothetical protein